LISVTNAAICVMTEQQTQLITTSSYYTNTVYFICHKYTPCLQKVSQMFFAIILKIVNKFPLKFAHSYSNEC